MKGLNAKQVRAVKRIAQSQAEKKCYIESNNFGASTATTPEPIAEVAQGDLVSEREGNQINPAGLTINYVPYSAAETAGVDEKYNIVRTIIFQWHPDNAADAPTLSEILSSTSYAYISPYQCKQGQSKFTILHDSTQTLNQNYADVEKLGQVTKVFIPGKKMRKMQFSGTATTGTNMLYLVIVSDSTTSNHPNVDYSYNFRFYDM